jgi:ubiquinone/menaquinone biosynthesis C-methylase UbiE
MNRLHHWFCNTDSWKRHVREELVPAALEGVDLGDKVLEVGPGFGPGTEALSVRGGRLTALELDPALAGPLRERLGERVEVVEGDGTAMPFADATFSGAACFTMLHHVPSRDAQDRLLAEVRRVLKPGGRFAGTDTTGRGLGFAVLHIGDSKAVIDADELPARLQSAGFDQISVRSASRDALRFSARRPS